MGKRGGATGSYASVAAAQPYGLIAMRRRGVRYWWASLGMVVLVLWYVGPIGVALRQHQFARPAAATPLPALSLPAVTLPQFRVPTVKKLAPLPSLPHHIVGAPPQARRLRARR